MSTELVTAHAGQNHVDSADIGELYAGAFGSGRYALDVGERLSVGMTDANTLHIGTGGFIFDGRWVRVTESGEDIKIANGGQGMFRKDLVTYVYSRDPSSGNIESGSWVVVQGEPASTEAAATAPAIDEGSILDGDLKASCAVAEVDVAGLTPTAKLLLPCVASLKAVGDSVSRVLARPGITLNGTVTVPGLKNRASVIVAFGGGQHAIMPTADGTHMVSGVAAGSDTSVVTALATVTVSGEQVTFSNATFNTFRASSLGSALTFVAGDKERIIAIYG